MHQTQKTRKLTTLLFSRGAAPYYRSYLRRKKHRISSRRHAMHKKSRFTIDFNFILSTIYRLSLEREIEAQLFSLI